MKRFTGGLSILIKGFLMQGWKATISTVIGAIFCSVIKFPISAIFGLFSERYETVEPFIFLFSFVLTLPIIDFSFEKMGGTDKKIKIK